MRQAPWILLALLAVTPPVHASEEPPVRLSEIVTDPQTDWNQDGRVTASDEFVELHNAGPAHVDLAGWILRLADSTPADHALSGTLLAGERLVVQNPTGDTNNDGHILLLDALGRVQDEVRYGAWPQATAPSGNAQGPLDESLRRLDAWTHGPATPHRPNDALGWRLANTLGASPGWVAANTSANFSATVYADASNPVRRLALYADGVLLREAVSSGTQQLQVSQGLALRATTHLVWSAERVQGAENQTLLVQVDDTPPELWIPSYDVWRNNSATRVRPATAMDAGVGGLQFQWQARGGLTNWSQEPSVEAIEPELVASVRARDAANNTTPWSAPIRIRLDATPPTAEFLAAEPSTPPRLAWDAFDAESGIVKIRLVRQAGSQVVTFDLDADAREFVDATVGTVPRVTYRVVAYDHAGNPSPPATINLTMDSAKPAVRAIRLSKTVWASGPLDVRIDFDRAMDTSVAPTLTTDPVLDLPKGRFLANRSTYLFTLSSAVPIRDGPLTIRVQGAVSGDGEELRSAAESRFLVDRTAPRLEADRDEAPSGSREVHLRAKDASPTTISWRVHAVGKPDVALQGQALGETTVALPGEGAWRLRATAVDLAGHRSDELDLTVLVDATAPKLEPSAAAAGHWNVRVTENGSGVDWDSASLSDPTWRIVLEPAKKRVSVQAGETPNATLRMRDLAGNEVALFLERAAAPVAPTASPEFAGTPWDAPDAKSQSQGRPFWLSAAAFVGGIATAFPVRRHMRARRRGSFSQRLRIVLAQTAPSDVVKDRPPG